MFSNKERDKAIVIAVAIIEKNGKLLMVQEGREDVRGKWNLPAGHADFGEDPISAVKREAREETGLEVEPKSVTGIYAFKDKESGLIALRFHFKCEVKGGSFEEQEGEILDIKWVSRKELETMKEKGQLRSERVWWAVQDWIDGREYPLGLIKVFKGIH